MAPFVHFELSPEQCKNCQALLAEREIQLVPKSRNTFERFDGRKEHETMSGMLVHDGREFHYQLFIASTHRSLRVHIWEHGKKRGLTLCDALDRVFPKRTPSKPEPPWEPSRTDNIKNALGCTAMLLVFLTSLFFMAYGIWAFFSR